MTMISRSLLEPHSSAVELSYSWLPLRASDRQEPHAADSSPIAVSVPPSTGGVNDSQQPQDQRQQSLPVQSLQNEQSQQPNERPPPGVCYTFFYQGYCERSGCQYRHTRPSQAHSGDSRQYDRNEAASRQSTQRGEDGSSSMRTEQYSAPRAADDGNRRSYSRAESQEFGHESSPSYSRPRSPYRSTTTRYDNHNNDPEYFGADRTYRPRGFQSQRPCFSYQRGYCKFGSQCAFSHDMEECSQSR